METSESPYVYLSLELKNDAHDCLRQGLQTE